MVRQLDDAAEGWLRAGMPRVLACSTTRDSAGFFLILL